MQTQTHSRFVKPTYCDTGYVFQADVIRRTITNTVKPNPKPIGWRFGVAVTRWS